MTNRNKIEIIRTLANWLFRIFKKWLWALGIIPTILDYVSVYLPKNYMPQELQYFLENGGVWQLTIILFVLGFIVSAFLVHQETLQELNEHERQIRNLQEKQPRLSIGFQDHAHHLIKRFQIQLAPLPPKPDLDALVKSKKSELLAKQRRPRSQNVLADLARMDLLSQPNPSYAEEVEEYLITYRKYLEKHYERSIAKDRTRSICPIAENQGNYPANNVRIEFAMPKAYREPMEHQLLKHRSEDIEDDELRTELEEMYDEKVCGLPREPRPFINLVDNPALSLMYDDIQPVSPPTTTAYPLSNMSGPNSESRDGVHYIFYQANNLVQHRLETDFEPFYLWLGDINQSIVWEIPVRVTSADLREPHTETLLVEITVANSVADSKPI